MFGEKERNAHVFPEFKDGKHDYRCPQKRHFFYRIRNKTSEYSKEALSQHPRRVTAIGDLKVEETALLSEEEQAHHLQTVSFVLLQI